MSRYQKANDITRKSAKEYFVEAYAGKRPPRRSVEQYVRDEVEEEIAERLKRLDKEQPHNGRRKGK